jgi:hypothetical protein
MSMSTTLLASQIHALAFAVRERSKEALRRTFEAQAAVKLVQDTMAAAEERRAALQFHIRIRALAP